MSIPSAGGAIARSHRAMVSLLELLHAGKVLNAKRSRPGAQAHGAHPGRPAGRVGDSSPAGRRSRLKDGWVLGPDNLYVMKLVGDRHHRPETYILAVYTMDDKTYGEGFRIVRHICSIIGARMVVRPRAHPRARRRAHTRARPKLARELALRVRAA